MWTITVTCKQCGSEYQPPRLAHVLGTWRGPQWCPVCHPQPMAAWRAAGGTVEPFGAQWPALEADLLTCDVLGHDQDHHQSRP